MLSASLNKMFPSCYMKSKLCNYSMLNFSVGSGKELYCGWKPFDSALYSDVLSDYKDYFAV